LRGARRDIGLFPLDAVLSRRRALSGTIPADTRAGEAMSSQPERITRGAFVAALLWVTLLAAIVALPAVVGWRELGPQSILDWDPLYRIGPPAPRPISSDHSPINQHYPRDLALANGLHEGRFDQWNSLVSGGAPLWAEQGAPFFPLKLPFYLWPSPATYDVYLALRLVLAGLGAYVLARRRGLGHVPALCASAAFELSGASIASLQHGACSPLYTLPWVLLGALEIARSRSRRAVAGAGIALALTASGGHPTLILMLFCAFAVAIAAHMAVAWRAPRRALAIGGAASLAVLLGLLLAAPSLLPLAELASVGSSYKNRPSGTVLWNLQLIESRMTLPIALFSPGALQALLPRFQSLFDFAPALGMLALVLGIAGMLRGALDLPLVAVAVFGIGLACFPPGFAWLHDLPGLRLVLPTYPWPLVLIAVTQAAGQGVANLSERRGRRAVLIAFVLAILGSTSLLVVAEIVVADIKGDPKLFGTDRFGTGLHDVIAGRAGAARLLAPPLFAAAALGVALALRRKGSERAGGMVLAALIALELLVEVIPMTWTRASQVLDGSPSSAVRFLRERQSDGESRMVALPYTVGQPMTGMIFGLSDFRGSAPLPVGRYQDYLTTIDRRSAQFTYQDILRVRSPLLDLAAVRYLVFARAGLDTKPLDADSVLVFPPDRPPENDPDLPVVYGDDAVVVFENRDALPRARVVHHVVPADDRSAATRQLAQWNAGVEPTAGAGTGPRDAVIVEPDERGRRPLPFPPPPAAPSDAESVLIEPSRDPDRLVLDARLASDGFVVVADTYYPGWRAWVDGEPTEIFPANLMFRAVRVPAGAHTIEFRYQPDSFRYGVMLFVCGVLATTMLMWRRGGPAPSADAGQTPTRSDERCAPE
jgi:hypothetical protein